MRVNLIPKSNIKERIFMNTDFIKGIIVPILTAIDENEVINEKEMRAQVDFVIEGGVL